MSISDSMLYPSDRVAEAAPVKEAPIDIEALKVRACTLIRDAVPERGKPRAFQSLLDMVASDRECYVLPPETIMEQIKTVQAERPVISQVPYAEDAVTPKEGDLTEIGVGDVKEG